MPHLISLATNTGSFTLRLNLASLKLARKNKKADLKCSAKASETFHLNRLLIGSVWLVMASSDSVE